MAAVTICSDLGAPKIKSDTVSTVSPSISHEVMGPDAMIFVFWTLSFKPTFQATPKGTKSHDRDKKIYFGGIFKVPVCVEPEAKPAESKEELNSLLMKVQEENEKNWLKTQHSKN